MHRRRISLHLIMPMALLLLGVAIIWHINTVFVADGATHTGPLDDSGLFPRIIGFALVILSGISLLQHLFQRDGAINLDGLSSGGFQLSALAILGTMIVYVAVLRWLGYGIATPLMLITACLILQCRLIWAVLLAVLGTFGMSLIFERVLNVQLPLGTLF